MYALGGFVFYLKIKHTRKAKSAKNTQSVLVKAPVRLADAADNMIFQILLPAERVGKSLRRAVCHGVDGEIPTGKVGGEVEGELHALWVAVVLIFAVKPKGGYLKRRTDNNGQRAVLNSCFDAVKIPKNRLHLFGRSRGCYVPIIGSFSEQ